MSEAEIPNNQQNLQSSNQPQPGIDSSADSTDSNKSINQPQDTEIVDDINQPLGGETETAVEALLDEAGDSQLIEALTWQSDLDVIELVNLSQSLQEQNSDLLGHVEQLEKLLDECHNALQSQMKRNQSLETRLEEQNQDIAKSQEQLTRLFRELEASHQVAQRQQILIETLNEQLESGQEQVAQVERECAQIQHRYNEQSYNLSLSENTCNELRSRLDRQQRYSLQLKAAFDKCLEVPAQTELASDTSDIPVEAQIQYYPQNASARLRLVLKPQPIQPWSASSASFAEDPLALADTSAPSTLDSPPPAEMAQVSDIGELSAAEPEALEEVFVNPNPVEKANISDDLPDLTADVSRKITEAEEVLWEELERLTLDAIASKNVLPQKNTVTPPTNFDAWDDVTEESSSHTSPAFPTPEPSIPSEPISTPLTLNDEAEDAAANWPSPVVYPQRPQKKIKSLAAIDLPSFPPLRK